MAYIAISVACNLVAAAMWDGIKAIWRKLR